MDNFMEHVEIGDPAKWACPCEQFVQHHTKSKHIASWIERRAGSLLRRHVGRRAEDCSWPRALRDCDVLLRSGSSFRQLCQTKVRQLRIAALREEDVFGLDVTMKDVGGMSSGKTVLPQPAVPPPGAKSFAALSIGGEYRRRRTP